MAPLLLRHCRTCRTWADGKGKVATQALLAQNCLCASLLRVVRSTTTQRIPYPLGGISIDELWPSAVTKALYWLRQARARNATRARTATARAAKSSRPVWSDAKRRRCRRCGMSGEYTRSPKATLKLHCDADDLLHRGHFHFRTQAPRSKSRDPYRVSGARFRASNVPRGGERSCPGQWARLCAGVGAVGRRCGGGPHACTPAASGPAPGAGSPDFAGQPLERPMRVRVQTGAMVGMQHVVNACSA